MVSKNKKKIMATCSGDSYYHLKIKVQLFGHIYRMRKEQVQTRRKDLNGGAVLLD